MKRTAKTLQQLTKNAKNQLIQRNKDQTNVRE